MGTMVALLVAALAALLAAPTAGAVALHAIESKDPSACTSQADPGDTSHWCCYRDPYGEDHCDEYERYCVTNEEGQVSCSGWVREWQCEKYGSGPWYCEAPDGEQCYQQPNGDWECTYPKGGVDLVIPLGSL